jgi:hypothetical protein
VDNYRAPSAHEQAWGPAPWLAGLTLLLMLGALVWRLLDHDPENRLVAAVLVVVLALTTLSLVRIRVRLRADTTGIAVTGPLHTRRIAWGRIHSISAPQRGRFGRRASVLEIEVRPDGGAADRSDDTGDTGDADDAGDADDELLTFGRFDLGTDPADVCRHLLRRQQAAAH